MFVCQVNRCHSWDLKTNGFNSKASDVSVLAHCRFSWVGVKDHLSHNPSKICIRISEVTPWTHLKAFCFLALCDELKGWRRNREHRESGRQMPALTAEISFSALFTSLVERTVGKVVEEATIELRPVMTFGFTVKKLSALPQISQ